MSENMEAIKQWMIEHGYEPCGETIEELLSELARQAVERAVNSGAK